MSMVNLGHDDDFDDVSPHPDYYIPNHKTKARLTYYENLVNQIDDYFEYMYATRKPDEIKEDIMSLLENFTEHMKRIYGKPE